MEPTHIEFYCEEDAFTKLLSVPSVRETEVYQLTKMIGMPDKYSVKYIICCPSVKFSQNLISCIRAWLREEYKIHLSDPGREVLFGEDRIWAQALKGSFDPHEYDLEYEIKRIQ